ncbi:MAG: YkgJ family cysteine cluster protein [Bacteroidia bacterium]|nr:YkgJ family cysteine cluster protein [Bacteroidia bacterium]
MNHDLASLPSRAADKKPETRRFFDRLRKRPPADLDDTVTDLHEAVFEETDCLLCANCCKTTSPVFTDTDIERIARHLRMKPGLFTETYLRLDEDRDYVLKGAPCPFLGPDNYCSVYEARPKACREYPHTNRKRFHQILIPLTLNNTAICPATFEIVERLKAVYQQLT